MTTPDNTRDTRVDLYELERRSRGIPSPAPKSAPMEDGHKIVADLEREARRAHLDRVATLADKPAPSR